MKKYKVWLDGMDKAQALEREFMDSVDAVESWLEHYADDDGATIPDEGEFLAFVECESVVHRFEVEAGRRSFEVHYLGDGNEST